MSNQDRPKNPQSPSSRKIGWGLTRLGLAMRKDQWEDTELSSAHGTPCTRCLRQHYLDQVFGYNLSTAKDYGVLCQHPFELLKQRYTFFLTSY